MNRNSSSRLLCVTVLIVLITGAASQPASAYIQSKTQNAIQAAAKASAKKTTAEKDFQTAEFYRRTGHPNSAYFCYEIVRRRYPESEFAAKAVEKMKELKEAGKVKTKTPNPGVDR